MIKLRLFNTGVLLVPPLFFVVISLCYCFSTPLWVPPDEDRHYVYSEYIARHKSLPYLDPREQGFKVSQAIHPPLYYVVASFFCRNPETRLQENLIVDESPGYARIKIAPSAPAEYSSGIAQSVYVLRLLSIFFSAITVFCLYRLVLIMFPAEHGTALAAAFIVAANPQFIHISASVSNEPMSTAFASLYLLILIVFAKKEFGYREKFIAGIVLGCCLLIKTSTLIYIPVTFLVLTLASPKNTAGVFKKFIFIILIAAGVSGWWYFRNLIMYADPVFSRALNIMQPWSLRGASMSLDYVLLVLKMTFISFFGFFGSMQVPLSVWHLGFYGALTAASGTGFILHLFTKNLSSEQVRIIIIMISAVVLGLCLYASFNVTYTMFMGRYLFVVIVPAAVCFSTGLRLLVPDRWRALLMLLASVLLAIVCWDVYFRIVNPSFTESGLNPGLEQKEFCSATPPLGTAFTIEQTFMSPEDNLCAVRVMFTCNDAAKTGTVRFVLKHEIDDPESIVTIETPVNQIEDFSKILFVFPPVANSRGKQFAFIFEAQETGQHEYPSLIYDKAAALEYGFLSFSKQRERGALFFATFHSSEDIPQKAWQGRRAFFAREGWYVSIRELQLYGEFSRESMLWRQVDEKIHRVEKMLLHRNRQ